MSGYLSIKESCQLSERLATLFCIWSAHNQAHLGFNPGCYKLLRRSPKATPANRSNKMPATPAATAALTPLA